MKWVDTTVQAAEVVDFGNAYVTIGAFKVPIIYAILMFIIYLIIFSWCE